MCCSCISHAYAFRFHKHKLGSANIYRFHRGLVTNQNQDRFYRYKKLSIKIFLKFCHRPFCIAFKKFIKHVCYVVWRNCGIRLKLLTSQFWKIGEVLGLRERDRYFESPLFSCACGRYIFVHVCFRQEFFTYRLSIP